MPQPRCPHCGKWFIPELGKGQRQKTCGAAECRQAHKQALNRRWWADNPACRQARVDKIRDRRRRIGYYDDYRRRNAKYVERNRVQTRERMRALRSQRKQDAGILANPLKYLEGLGVGAEGLFATQELAEASARREDGPRPTVFATQELVVGFSVGIWRYLRARERFATREGADGKAAGTI
jgi:hypothetical protein